ncbi:hypothetical protein CEUSTIGMA_g13090.t1 [Chlamydomonas eustigma]|uniref:Uncharacterized protein n=1 Tax=Chlamydomonas eustigma TaxID=1157962 RepID=A0A250XRK7_9CHLO|nr:hypothetical protein CEUSTIGMA_g13090.t1 [Chlamydomonas eustigma]|eukprot:GAX85676.1 hypothetical protein CEUSTIGMA_g13090.t1 [Chlamydomonas eustigma]
MIRRTNNRKQTVVGVTDFNDAVCVFQDGSAVSVADPTVTLNQKDLVDWISGAYCVHSGATRFSLALTNCSRVSIQNVRFVSLFDIIAPADDITRVVSDRDVLVKDFEKQCTDNDVMQPGNVMNAWFKFAVLGPHVLGTKLWHMCRTGAGNVPALQGGAAPASFMTVRQLSSDENAANVSDEEAKEKKGEVEWRKDGSSGSVRLLAKQGCDYSHLILVPQDRSSCLRRRRTRSTNSHERHYPWAGVSHAGDLALDAAAPPWASRSFLDRGCRARRLHHVPLDAFRVLHHVVQDAVLQHPPEEVELADGGLLDISVPVKERYTVPTPERVKLVLRVRLELGSVAHVHVHAVVAGAGVDHHVLRLGVVGHKPVDQPQAHLRLTADVRKDAAEPVARTVEGRQRRQQQVHRAQALVLDHCLTKERKSDGRTQLSRAYTHPAFGSLGRPVDMAMLFETASPTCDDAGPRVVVAAVKFGQETKGTFPTPSKGPRTPSSTFGNQVTMSLRVFGTLVNVKVFRNGSLQMTGLKAVEHGPYIVCAVSDMMPSVAVDAVDASKFTLQQQKHSFRVCLINCDLDLGFRVRRDSLQATLSRFFPRTRCSYEPCIYQGLKIKFMVNRGKSPSTACGACNCASKCSGAGDGRDTCRKVTIAIFQTGKVILTGAVDASQIEAARSFLVDVLVGRHRKCFEASAALVV